MEEVKAEEKQYCKQLNMTSGGESKKRFPVKKQSRSSDGSTMQKIVCGGVLLLLVFSEGASAATALPVIMREENVYSSTGSSEFLTFRIPGNGTISADLCFSPLNVCVNVTRDWMYLEGTANYTLRILPEYNETTMVLIVRDSTGSHYSNSINMTVNKCTQGSIRLQGGTSTQGRVEICKYNEWGTVCNDHWDAPNAEVVCRQLDLPSTGAVVLESGYTNAARGTKIWLDDVQCHGNETRLIDCPGSSSHNCLPVENVGVGCPTDPDPGQNDNVHPIMNQSMPDSTSSSTNTENSEDTKWNYSLIVAVVAVAVVVVTVAVAVIWYRKKRRNHETDTSTVETGQLTTSI